MFEPLLQKLAPFAAEFSRRGKEIYLVGGAVRNLLLGRPAEDFDFTTDALPAEVQSYFRKVLPTGLQHGTVTVLFQGEAYEVTTFRVDGTYSDGRRPDGVTFTPSLAEDLARRDFTINALALNLADGSLADFHRGQEDLEHRVLRAIGDPGTRFDEDALRLLRLYRFAAQLNFSIDPATEAAVPGRRAHLAAVSRERVREELVKAMAGLRPDRAWGPLAALGFLTDIFSPLEPRPLSKDHLAALADVAVDLRWSVWLTLACPHDVDAWEIVLKRLTFSNALVASVLGPCRALDWVRRPGVGPGDAKAIIEAWGSRERAALGVEYLAVLERWGDWTDTNGLKAELVRAAASQEPIFLGELAVNGRSLILAGMSPGPGLGRTLKALQAAVWADPALNDGPTLLDRAWSLR
jgi:tRNA nucleotidyltransferase (CCA-adding enzyme)